MKTTVLLILCIYSMSVFSSGTFVTGNDLYPLCDTLSNEPQSTDTSSAMKRGRDIGICYSSVGVAFESITKLGYVWAVDGKFMVCMEDYYEFYKYTGQQVLDMTMKYLRENPKYRTAPISVIMAGMMRKNFPDSVCLKHRFTDSESKQKPQARVSR